MIAPVVSAKERQTKRDTMRKLSELSMDELHNYDSLIQPVIHFVRTTWENTDKVKPWMFDEIKRQLQRGELDEATIERLVQGLTDDAMADVAGNETDTQFSWAEMLTPWRTANESDVFHCNPIEVLLRVVFSFGMNVADEQHKRKSQDTTTPS